MFTEKKQTMAVLQYHGKSIAFEEIEGKIMVNATQMAKSFGKQPIDWLKTQQAEDLLNAIVKLKNISLADLQIVRRGGRNSGTFFHEDVALLFSQWLSPEFYVLCNDKLKELLAKQSLTIPPKHNVNPIVHEGKLLYPYNAVMQSLTTCKRPSASRRKKKYPEHFIKIYGRNFITGLYFDLLKGYYDYKNASNQLKLSI